MRQKSFSLLSKFTLFFILFLGLFITGSVYIVHKTNEHINNNINQNFERKQVHIAERLNQGVKPTFFTTLTVEKTTEKNAKFKTTHREYIESDQNFIEQKSVIEAEVGYYFLTQKRNITELKRIKSAILKTLIITLSGFIILIILFNLFLPKLLFKPFNHIISQIKNYKIGESKSFTSKPTSTREFQSLQQIFMKMTHRAEKDFNNLKQYTDNMAHELQTPLAIIRSKTENLISDNDLMVNHTQNIKSIYKETNNLSKLSKSLKLLSKIENKEFTNKTNILSESYIKNLILSFSELTDLKNIRFEQQMVPDHVFYIDEYLLDIMLKNLINNAILYSEKDSIIHIKTTKTSFTISNPSSISKPLDQKIFDRFYNDNNSVSLGLGLSLVKKICEINKLVIQYSFENNQNKFTISSLNS